MDFQGTPYPKKVAMRNWNNYGRAASVIGVRWAIRSLVGDSTGQPPPTPGAKKKLALLFGQMLLKGNRGKQAF